MGEAEEGDLEEAEVAVLVVFQGVAALLAAEVQAEVGNFLLLKSYLS